MELHACRRAASGRLAGRSGAAGATPEACAAPQAHLQRLLARVHVEALLFGNLTAEDAAALADGVCAALPGEPMPAAERPLEEVAALPEGSSLLVRRARGSGQGSAARARVGPGQA